MGEVVNDTKDIVNRTIQADRLLQYLRANNFNTQSLCRICLSTNNDEFTSLLDLSGDETLAEMFTCLTLIPITGANSQPVHVCGGCSAELDHCNRFRSKCLQSEDILRSIQSNLQLKLETDVTQTLPNVTTEVEIKHENDIYEDVQYLEEGVEDSLNMLREDSSVKNETDLLKMIKVIKNGYKKKEVVPKSRRNKKKFQCDLCPKKCSSASSLSTHVSRAHAAGAGARAGGAHACSVCKKSFESAQDLRLHAALHGTPPWTCPECNKEFTERARLRRHVSRHLQRARHTCACGKTFAERYALRRHARVHSGERPPRNHACDLCGKRFVSRALLTAHAHSHSGARPCVCACGRSFPSARLLASHRRVHDDRKPYACQHCDKRFRHESTRNTHVRTHTGEKPYVCSFCGKTFIQNSNLTLHMRTHTGERPYSCEVCARRFTSSSALKSHRRTHSAEKPYCCQLCGKKTRKSAHAHVCAHLRPARRPLACVACPKRYTSAAQLRDHARVHTGERPFECEVCGEGFITKSHLNKHLKTHLRKSDDKKKVSRASGARPQRAAATSSGATSEAETEPAPAPAPAALELAQEMPLEVSGELVLHENGEVKTDEQPDGEVACYRAGGIYLSGDGGDAYAGGVDLVRIDAPAEPAIKLYQLDQSLLQIHTAGGQLTISRISSKMTTNF